MLPLIVKSKLFFQYAGRLDCCWYLSYAPVVKQDAYIRDMNKFGADTITMNLCNEEIGTPFSGEFMASSLDDGKVNSLLNYIVRLKSAGKNVVIVFFDCPQIPDSQHPKYPYWKFMDRIPGFIEIATKALAPMVDGFILGIETNRGPLNPELVNAGVGLIRQYAVRNGVQLPVGTHEQSYRVAANADFVGYETHNHPVTQGDSTSVADMVRDVQGLIDRAGGKPVWVIESNSSEGSRARAQNLALATISGVVGVNMPM